MQCQGCRKPTGPDEETGKEAEEGCGYTIDQRVENRAQEADPVPDRQAAQILATSWSSVPERALTRDHHLERTLQQPANISFCTSSAKQRLHQAAMLFAQLCAGLLA